MTKEQEVIKYIETRIKICNENADICDDNNFDEEATYLREESYMLETVLNTLKEKDVEIEKKDKIIDLMAEFLGERDLGHYKKEDAGEILGIMRRYNKEDWKQHFKEIAERKS